jgi:hypothetical protein
LSQSPPRLSAPNWNRRANDWCKAGAAASRFEAASAPLSFEDDLTGVPPRQQRRQRLAGLGQRKNFRDQRLEPAGLPPAQQLGEVAADQGGVSFGLRAPDDADDRDVLDQDQMASGTWEVRFAGDSPLEGGVTCELVSGNPDFNVRKKENGRPKAKFDQYLDLV